MSSWQSYPKIYNLGHSAIAELFDGPVIIEEKVDGSQFSFGIFNGELKMRSKGQEIVIDAPEKMFSIAVEKVKEIQHKLVNGWTYRAEYLRTKSHNALNYDRIPTNHLMVFDINFGEERYLDYESKKKAADKLGFEVVPLVFEGIVTDFEMFSKLIDRVSILGGQKIEGVVIKNYSRFGIDKKVLLGKHVSESFKEVHKNNWKSENPTQGDLESVLCAQYRSKARWNKAIQHLNEKGQLTNTPQDIGKLLVEIQSDIHAECETEIKDQLYATYFPKIKRGAIRGFPEWYKEQLAKSQFNAIEQQ